VRVDSVGEQLSKESEERRRADMRHSEDFSRYVVEHLDQALVGALWIGLGIILGIVGRIA
jgi:hypothetical protein